MIFCFQNLIDDCGYSHMTPIGCDVNVSEIGTKRNSSWYDGSDVEHEKRICYQNMIPYIVLALQEFRKFEHDPIKVQLGQVQQKYDDLKTKYNSLVSYLTTSGIIPTGQFNLV